MNQQNLVLTLLQNLILCSQTQFIPSEMYQIPNLYIYQELMSIYKLKMFIFKEAFTQYFVRLRVDTFTKQVDFVAGASRSRRNSGTPSLPDLQ